MKIIKGKDYYDGAGYGVDETVMFIRDPKVLKVPDVLHMQSFSIDHKDKRRFQYPRDHPTIFMSYVILAGKAYPVVYTYYQSKNKFHIPTNSDLASLGIPGKTKISIPEFFYSIDDFKMFHNWDEYYIYGWGLKDKSIIRAVERYFSEESQPNSNEVMKWSIDNNAVHAFVTEFETRPSKIPPPTFGIDDDKNIIVKRKPWSFEVFMNHENKAIANHDFLKSLQFYKCVDPHTCHMEIANFISGVLPESKPMIELTNNDRIQKAGFDLKKSFRKEPKS